MINFETSNGTEIQITQNADQFTAFVIAHNKNYVLKTNYVISTMLNNQLAHILDADGAAITIADKDLERVKKYFQDAQDQKFESALPGYKLVQDALQAKARAFRDYDNYMHHVHNDIYPLPYLPDCAAAEKNAKELSNLYPKAAAYITWSKSDSASNIGFAQLQAAKMLLAGTSLAECEKIIKNAVNQFDN